MKVVDLETMSTKQFIAALSAKFGGADLTPKKKFIKATITEIIDAMENDVEDGDATAAASDGSDIDSSSDDDDDALEVDLKPKKKGSMGGLSTVKEISDELSEFLECGKHMARTAIVKSLWEYIKKNNLQNPADKREILLDEKMKAVFGVDTFTMFSMNKYIGAHIEPYKPVDLNSSSKDTMKRKASSQQRGRKGTKKKVTGTHVAYRLSDALQAVVGKRVLPRQQVTQALWTYIREKNLQNPGDKREIICDTQLSRIMGGQGKVTMFSMNKFITAHLLEKADRSEYVHEEDENGVDDESYPDQTDDYDDSDEE